MRKEKNNYVVKNSHVNLLNYFIVKAGTILYFLVPPGVNREKGEREKKIAKEKEKRGKEDFEGRKQNYEKAKTLKPGGRRMAEYN